MLSAERTAGFWSRALLAPSGCIEWAGPINPVTGYGVVYLGCKSGKTLLAYAHRVAYELSGGPIPEGLQIDHLCRNRRCVSPAHLEAVTARVNNLRSESVCARHARQTHCVHGHPFDELNTVWYFHEKKNSWYRRCLTCTRTRADRRNEQRRQAGQLAVLLRGGRS